MRQLIFLGTGAAMATECFNSCFLIRTQDGEYFMTDSGGGGGIIRQMKLAEVPFERLSALFISHGHIDHISGAIWVIQQIAILMNRDIYDGKFHIYGNDIVCQIIEMMCQLLLPRENLAELGRRIIINEIGDGDEVMFLNMKLIAFDIHSTKAKQFGYRLRFPNRHSLVFLGDEPFHPECRAYAEKADWLISEAFCLDGDSEHFRPHEKSHGTVREAAEAAAKLNSRRLVLCHTEDSSLRTRKKSYTQEAKNFFSGEVFVPDDLDIIEID